MRGDIRRLRSLRRRCGAAAAPHAYMHACPHPDTPRHPRRRYRLAMSESEDPDTTERWLDIDVKLAYQERLIHQLDTLVREFSTRLEAAERELRQIKQAIPSPVPLGTANEKPPHY
jgi:uncharacterized coiled-coil protein SlyX